MYNYARRLQHGSVGSKKEKKHITKHHGVKTKKKQEGRQTKTIRQEER